ncbi:MAG TPA: hypothetical protein VMG11_15655 [Steroidobacteraceae bacterium]|nr:hypothetical protein [Steroidobacteraceae bacterium]
MSAQDLSAAITAAFIVGMIWLRTRMQYAGRKVGTLRLRAAGRTYFAAVVLLLAVGWFAAPALGHSAWPGAGSMILRVLWFLATYYVFIIVHRVLQRRRIDVFGGEAS